jgi:hypothetical protein
MIDDNLIKQYEIINILKKYENREYFVKNIPSFVVKYKDLTDELKSKVGDVDKTKYEDIDDDSCLIVQFDKNGGIDIYKPSKESIEKNYNIVSFDHIPNDIKYLLDRYKIKPIKALLKNTPVKMIKINDVGIKPHTKIETHWGHTQTVKEGAFIVDGKTEAYVVQMDSNGNPIGYVPFK